MNSVTIVIPTWNGIEYLKMCLDSLRLQTMKEFSVLVVDNGSVDGTAVVLRESYPEVKLLSLPENVGFAGGVNRGIQAAATPYVLLLNNDIACDPHFVEEQVKRINADEKIFSVSPQMIRYRERELLDDCGDFYTILGYQAQRGTGQSVDHPKYQVPARVFSACGGAAIYRKCILDEIGLFDEHHFAYLEDIDLGYRANLYGYRNVYEPKAKVYHIGSATSGGTMYSDFKVRLSARNNQYVLYKNMPLFFRIVNALPLWIGRKVKESFFRKKGYGQAFRDGLKEAKETRKQLTKVPLTFMRFLRSCKLEFVLIGYTFVYLTEYLRRHK